MLYCPRAQVYKALMEPAREAAVPPPPPAYMLGIVRGWQQRGWLNEAQQQAVVSVLQLPPEGGVRLIQVRLPYVGTQGKWKTSFWNQVNDWCEPLVPPYRI